MVGQDIGLVGQDALMVWENVGLVGEDVGLIGKDALIVWENVGLVREDVRYWFCGGRMSG